MKNENIFIELIEKIDSNENLLLGKIDFGTTIKEPYVSVDNAIEFDDQIFLFEIDSSNQAKLITGQYILLNLLINLPKHDRSKNLILNKKKKFIFFVIHFYKKYNPKRSKKNLNFIYNVLLKSGHSPIDFGSMHIDDFQKFIEEGHSAIEFKGFLNENLTEINQTVQNVPIP